MAKTLYCLDTSALIQPWNTYYAMDLCPDYWAVIDKLAADGVFFCTMEVKREIKKKDDGLSAWVEARPHIFREITEDVQRNLRRILATHKELVKAGKDRSMADAWVVAHAITENATVVTKEGFAPRKIKIPDVCGHYSVRCIDDVEFVRETGVRFSAKV